MKKLPALFYILTCIATISCMHHDGNINLTYRDSDNYYSMNADFNQMMTRNVDAYMNKKIGAASNISFSNMQSDATILLNDHTNFYMKKYPGHIEIRLDKNQNSYAAYQRIKALCLGMKKVLTK